jgi:hypothetical protein
MIVFKAAFRRRIEKMLRASKLNIVTLMNLSKLSCEWFKIRINRGKVRVKISRFLAGVTPRKGIRNQES